MPEFQATVLDSLRQPLENGHVTVARANHRVTYPARFQLVAAMNPCRCGHATDPGYACHRQPNARCVAQYTARLSDPLLDRIDMHVEVPAVTVADVRHKSTLDSHKVAGLDFSPPHHLILSNCMSGKGKKRQSMFRQKHRRPSSLVLSVA